MPACTTSLPESGSLSSARRFAECFLLGIRQSLALDNDHVYREQGSRYRNTLGKNVSCGHNHCHLVARESMHACITRFFLYIKAVIFDQWRRRSALLQYIYHKNLVLQKAVKPSQSLLATKGKIDWPGM